MSSRGESRLRAFAAKLRGFLRGPGRDAEFEDEIHEHVQLLTERFVAQGISREEAAAAARRQFGNTTLLQEGRRELQTLPSIESLWHDVRYGLRMLRKAPGFTAVAVLTLALGIGANTALFSVVNGVLLNPLPYPHPERLISLAEKLPPFPRFAVSYPDFLDWTQMNRTFEAMAAYRQNAFNLTGAGEAQRVKATQVSASFFPLLGVKPVVGRTFSPDEDRHNAAPVVMLSALLWKTKFEASPAILGKTLTLDGVGYTVIGVVPQDFYFCCESTNFRLGDVYVPLGSWNVSWMQDRGAHPGLFAVGRLRAGTTLEEARADMDQVARNLAAAYPDSDKNAGAALMPLKEEMVGNTRPTLLALLAAVGFVLLIACANVANILLARSTERAQEFAIRRALGATEGRVIRQLAVESILLAIGGGTLGFLFAAWGTRGGLALLPEALPRAKDVQMDAHVLLFTFMVSVIAAVLFGFAPILQISSSTVQTLKKGGRGTRGARDVVQRVFVAVEIALAVVLLISAGLTIRSLANLWGVQPGFDPRNVVTFTVALPPSTAKQPPDQIRANLHQLTDGIAAIPGVMAAAQTDGAFPMAGDMEVGFWIEGRPRPSTQSEMPNAMNYMVSSDYLKAMGIPLLEGRFFTPQDNIDSRPVIVIDEKFARQYFRVQNPLGEHIHLAGLNAPFEVVGVVGHVSQWGLNENQAGPITIQIYTAVAQIPDQYISFLAKSASFVVRIRAPQETITADIRHSVGQINNQQAAYDFESMEGIISGSLA